MGSAGMKRRGRRHLPKIPGDLGPDDTARLFQQFRWSQFTPAGMVERAGFFARQAARNGTSEGWKWGFGAVVVVAPFIFVAGLVVFVVARLLD
jgi:hypothetical protein